MQSGYEVGGGNKETCGIVAEGFGELRPGVEDKGAKQSTRITEFAIFLVGIWAL